jgi:hypothetical protein
MKTVAIVLALLVQDPPFQNTAEHLKPIEWLVGTWVGEVDAPPYGKMTAEYVYEWTLNGNFMRQDYRMTDAKGKVIWHDTGMLGWDRDKKKLVGFNFGMDGTIGWGMQVEGDPRQSITFEGNTTGPYKNFRVRLTREGDDRIVAEMFTQKGEEWKAEGPKQLFVRKKKEGGGK